MEAKTLVYAGITVVAIIAVYYITTWNLDYWNKRMILGPRPIPLFGNFAPLVFRRLSLTEVFAKFYAECKNHSVVGVFSGQIPILVIRDLDLVRRILIKDFHVFPGNGLIFNENVDPLFGHLFVSSGPRWKYLRGKVTPIFSGNKLRHMFDLVKECADHFESYLCHEIEERSIVECQDLAAKYTIYVIGSCAFGIDVKSFDRHSGEFLKWGKKAFDLNNIVLLKSYIQQSAPRLFEFFQIQMYPTEMSNFFVSSISETIRHREQENFLRNDMIDVLIRMKENHDFKELEMTDEFLAAQAFIFFAAGFETSSATISFSLYELAYYPEIQRKLRAEILSYLEKYDGKIAYDTIQEMNYFDKVIQETLRKNPPATVLQRIAGEPYSVPNSDVKLEKGQKIMISIYGIHHDPEYYPDPEIFDPERFTEEAKQSRHPMAYIPFSHGPKNCIGGRFGVFQVKLALIKILKNYHVVPTERSPRPYRMDTGNFMLSAKHGIHLRFEPLQKF